MDAEKVQDQLNEIAQEIKREEKAKRIFVAVPNMNDICMGLVNKLFHYAMQRKYDPWFHFVTEKRHADFARNQIAKAFMESTCDVCLMIDHDVDPHIDLLEMVELDKDIIAGNVFCWIRGELMSSIWQKAECEQCRNIEIFIKEHKVHDGSQYRMDEAANVLERWNPFYSRWEAFANSDGILEDRKCRCKGTGMDPFVFRTHQSLRSGEPLKVDSVGSAALMIQRRVFERMAEPFFRFLYRPNCEILVTEDHYFCWKAQEFGFEVWAAPKYFCSHYKTVDLLQLTGLINKAYETGKKHGQLNKSILIPEEK